MIKLWNEQEVVHLYSEGFSSNQIHKMLKPPVTVRQIQRIVKGYGLTRPYKRSGRERRDQDFISLFRSIVDQLLQEHLGLDPYFCYLCYNNLDKKAEIHHLKYEGATLYDLTYACRRCQTQPVNVGLA